MWYFGIRGKVAILVICATAASAFLVTRMLSTSATRVLREHELVDLGDEASLRGWEFSGQIQALRDDIFDLVDDEAFRKMVADGETSEQVLEKAKDLCRRYWKEHLRVELVRLGKDGEESQILTEKAEVATEDVWFPPADGPAGSGFHLSEIQRILLTHSGVPGYGTMKRWEPVVWAVAPVDVSEFDEDAKPTYVRILMTLYSPPSPRHLFAMETENRKQLIRHDETEPIERGNDAVFLSFMEDPLVQAAFQKSITIDPNAQESQTKVDRLVISQNVPLNAPYYFQEGVPGPMLTAALDFQPEEQFLKFYERLVLMCEGDGRIGGLRSGVRELRILAQTPQKLHYLRDKVLTALAEEYGGDFDGIDWRDSVECDEINAWTVRLLVGDGPEQQRYLLHYAVLDDELASSISHEMATLRKIAAMIAGGFGILGFLISMLFISPLKKMTRTALAITESEPERLYDNLRNLARDLDTRRRDEVGDIARSSKRLFEELIQFHEKLEQRVYDRTQELQEANEKLQSLSREKDAFVAKVSHDLRQPLNAIFLQVEALKLSELDEMQKEDVDRIHTHAERELNLVNDILEYQKIIMGAESLTRDTVNIQTVMDDLADAHRPSATAKGVDLILDYPEDIGHIIADDRRLRQILGNLTNNACKFTKEGSVTIAAKPLSVNGSDWVDFSVTDTGRGMSPEEQAKVFEPFVSNKKDNAGGSGLGLSICKELTAQMGGKIGFVSELGKGTEFSISLPREPDSEHYRLSPARMDDAEPNENGWLEQIEVKPSDGPPKSGTILVIDDEERIRTLLTRLLEKEGYSVITATDGASGLKCAIEEQPDAITLDVLLPGGLDGWGVLRELKEHPETEHIPVVMVTVEAEDSPNVTLDVEDYLVKPVDVDRLGRVISRVTHRSMQRNILLVDDEVDSLQSLSRILKKAGWQTTLATDGKEALAALGITRPAAIVLDLMMPVMDGFEFLRELQKQSHLRSIPVIVMTGKEPTEEEREFLMNMGTSLLSKGPRSGRELLDCIHQRIRNRETAVA